MNILDKLQTRLGPLGDHAHYAHGYYAYPRLEGEISNKMIFNGKEKLIWSLNNYLGLANNPEVREADNEGTRRYGHAYPMGARMMSGNTKLHEKFEAEISDYVGKEDAFLLNYGYQGMVSIIDSLVEMIILRLIPTADHTLEDVERTITVFSEIRLKLLAGHYKQEVGIAESV